MIEIHQAAEARRGGEACLSSHVPHHLVPLSEGWALWRWVCVRGAGFPAGQVLSLAMPECAAAADELLAREAELATARARALGVCEANNQLGAEGAGKALGRAIKRLRGGHAPEPFDAVPAVAAALSELRRAEAPIEPARAQVRALFEAGTVRVGEALREAARQGALREAMLWQNRGAVRGTVDALLRRPAGAVDSKTREHERLVASYIQRYCVKNDTIGFFGPVGWGRLSDHGPALTVRPGRSLLARRTVYFEAWGVQLLADRLSESPELRRFVAPRMLPTVRLEGTTLHHSIGRASELPVDFAHILAACDGERSAQAIAEALSADPSLGLSGEDEVFELLGQLAEKRLITWTLEIPTVVAHPERTLRAILERMPQGDASARALGALSDLEARRDAVVRASNDEIALERGLSELAETFERLTGAAGDRRGGEAYAGRTLVFEDCVRDADIELGPELLRRLAPPLLLLLRSARWYTYTIAARYYALLRGIYRDLARESGPSPIDFLRFWQAVEPHFTGSQYEPSPIVAEVIGELRARWAKILAIEPDQRRVERSAAALRAEVEAAFAAPHPGWPGARYHSPDLMIAARGPEAVRRGDYRIVLGELHTGENTASNPVFLNQHPDPAALLSAIELDLPEPRIAPVIPKQRSTRADQISFCPHDIDVEIGATRSWRPRTHVVPISGLVVEEAGGQLIVRTRDGARRFHAIAFFEHYLKLESLAHFSLLPALPRTPRVALDGLVVSRERWRFAPADLGFAELADPLDRFLGARRWARRAGLPRLVFVRIPEEVKPCYLDLDSPVYVEIFAKLVRRASAVSITEMLPAIDEAWLLDAEGRSYTSELRIVALDAEPWRAT
ncbi:lantibiotic dehydratase [Sorangium sp. So ce1078]|uniref:lantibiotic dehydratase n=1 Tax=Sorangium sp. So ce1078 TaxID=3133329 RepID=UPI003F5E0562